MESWNTKGTTKSIDIQEDIADFEFKNNIILQSTGFLADSKSLAGNGFNYNLWSSLPESDAVGDYDIISAAVLLSKTSDWHNISAGSLSPDDFKLQSTSLAINAGTTLGSPYNLDYFGTARPQPAQGGWDIGAHEYTAGSSDTTAPASPSGLVVR